MFNRQILDKLRLWASRSEHKPLVMRGARQVGKTFAVRLFGKEFDRFIEMNLEIPDQADLFRRGLSVGDLWQAILLSKNLPMPQPGDRTLLFLDEVQNSPEAVALLRFFHEELPGLFLVAAGSLLDAMLFREQISFPVGRVEYMFMRPLTFPEFLGATGEHQALVALDTVPAPDFAFPMLLALFHRFTLVGGMPEIVEHYRQDHDIAGLKPTYRSLLTGYLDDAGKYSRNDTMKAVIRHCIQAAPFEAGSRISFAGFGNSNYRSREVGEALRTLEQAMLITLLRPSVSTAIPIWPDFRKKPRLQFLDTGLINHFVGLQDQFFAHDDLHGFYRGLLAEHIVGQELLALTDNPLQKLCFWVREKSQSRAEVDFLIQDGPRPIPLEVKAGKTGTLRSLHQFMDASNGSQAVRLQARPMQVDDAVTPQGRHFRLLSLPYFLAGKITEHLEWNRNQG